MVAEQFSKHLILWLKNFRPTFYGTIKLGMHYFDLTEE